MPSSSPQPRPAAADGGRERRRYTRVPLRLITHFHRVGERQAEGRAQGVTQDVSRGGVFVETHMRLEVGDTVEFTLVLNPEKRHLSAKVEIVGEVRWQRRQHPPGVGIRIRRMTVDGRARLEAFLREQREG
jgi:uncharacterized protein (TIGR02266 family)